MPLSRWPNYDRLGMRWSFMNCGHLIMFLLLSQHLQTVLQRWHVVLVQFPDHIEVNMPSFEKEDLRRLIKSTTKDLEEADKWGQWYFNSMTSHKSLTFIGSGEMTSRLTRWRRSLSGRRGSTTSRTRERGRRRRTSWRWAVKNIFRMQIFWTGHNPSYRT